MFTLLALRDTRDARRQPRLRAPFTIFAALLALLAGMVGQALAAGLIVVTQVDEVGAPPVVVVPPDRRLPRPPAPYYRLQTLSVQTNVTIKDQLAVTEIDQVFFNPSNARLEGQFIFPIPAGAHLDKFTMDVNGQQQAAELVDADKARQVYLDIVRKAQDPALLEYMGRGLYKARIFPIEPQSKKRVVLRYSQILRNDAGLISYEHPLNTKKYSSDPVQSLSMKVSLETTSPIKAIYSPSHKVEIVRKDDTHATVGFEQANVVPDADFHLCFATPKGQDELGLSLMVHRDERAQIKGEDGYFMLLVSPGLPKRKEAMPKDVVFVIDTSGSMSGPKMDQARKALTFCVRSLNLGDRYDIVRFSTDVEPLFGKLATVDETSRKAGLDFVAGLQALGGTAIMDALQASLKPLIARGEADKDRPYAVVFITDGKPTIGSQDPDEIVAALGKTLGERKARVFSVGVGVDLDVRLLDRIAERTHAFSQYVLPEEDLELKLGSFYARINNPVLADVDLKFVGADEPDAVKVKHLYPSSMPDLFLGDQLVIMGRFAGKPGKATILLTGVADGKRQEIRYAVDFGAKGLANPFIPRLWASRRVGALLQQIRLHGENPELKDEVTQLARQYGIVTPYTSYLILEDEARRNVPVAMRGSDPGATGLGRPGDGRARGEGGSVMPYGASSGASRPQSLDKLASGAEAVERSKKDSLLRDAESEADRRAAMAPAKTAPAPGRKEGEYRQGNGNAAGKPAGPGASQGQPGTAPADNAPAADSAKGAAPGSGMPKDAGGKTFYFNGQAWVDAAVSKAAATAKREKLAFNSDAWLALLDKHPDAPAWLSVGKSVIVLIGETIYEIEP